MGILGTPPPSLAHTPDTPPPRPPPPTPFNPPAAPYNYLEATNQRANELSPHDLYHSKEDEGDRRNQMAMHLPPLSRDHHGNPTLVYTRVAGVDALLNEKGCIASTRITTALREGTTHTHAERRYRREWEAEIRGGVEKEEEWREVWVEGNPRRRGEGCRRNHVRTNILLVYLGLNMLIVIFFTSTLWTNWTANRTNTNTNYYQVGIFWSVAALSAFRFFGSTLYLIMRLFGH